jgi:nucleotide-binding universal stress UspA family protein
MTVMNLDDVPPPRKIVVPVTLSREGREHTAIAARLAEALGAELVLVVSRGPLDEMLAEVAGAEDADLIVLSMPPAAGS